MVVLLVAGAACHVPDKQRPSPDGGADDAAIDTRTDPQTDTRIDTEAPQTMIDQAPDPFSRTEQATFRFSSDDAGATFACWIDGEAAQPCQSPYVRVLSDGAHRFSVRAVDADGNGDDTPAERAWTIDTIAPDTQLTDTPSSADNGVMARFAFGASEPGVTFDCALDDAGYAPCASGASFGPLDDSAHAFAVRARDRAGNLDPSPAIYAWLVDTIAPDTQILDGPTGVTASTAATFSFDSPDAGTGAMFECALDGEAFAACASPRAYAALATGPHDFAVQARDVAGNLDPSPARRSWTIDLAPLGAATTRRDAATTRRDAATTRR